MATRANSTTLSRAAIMQAAHRLYRSWRAWQIGAKQKFTRRGFAHWLRQAWAEARQIAAAAARLAALPPVAPATMEEAIDATKYLPLHMSQARAIERIRSRYAAVA